MAESPITLPEIVTINDRNLSDADVPDFLNSAPFMRTNYATIASHDTLEKWLQYTNPDVGWRDANDGREVQSSKDTRRQAECGILDASMRTDLALAESYRRAGASGWINREASRHLDAAFYQAEIQAFNGRGTAKNDPDDAGFYSDTGTGLGADGGAPNGFPNFAFLGTIGNMCVDAGGTGNRTSAYVVRSGMFDAGIVLGRSGNISIGDTTVQETPGSTTGTYPALYTPITGWYAFKIGSQVTSVVRIANIDATGATGTPFDDDLLYAAIRRFGSGRQPTHVYLNRDVLELLRKSRTATNPSGTPAPRPTTIEGIPIIPTDGLLVGEAAVI